jgi:hypothetical protein
LRTNNDGFYNYIVRSVLDHDDGRIVEAKLFIDKRGPKTWRNAIAAYLRQLNASGQHKLLAIRQKDGKRIASCRSPTCIAAHYTDTSSEATTDFIA